VVPETGRRQSRFRRGCMKRRPNSRAKTSFQAVHPV
jgi:hypothetical protein